MASLFSSGHRLVLILMVTAAAGACQSRQKPPAALEITAPGPVAAEASPRQPQGQASQLEGPAVGAFASGSVQDFVVNVGDRVYFDYDQYSIRADASRILDAQAAWLARYPAVSVRIEGNADERGTREYNFALGARRAEAVRTYLMSRGVAASRVSVMSFGKERPLDPGSDEQAWSRNRNAHTNIVSGAQ